MISNLSYYSTSNNGMDCTNHPTRDDIVNKINEIIEYLNEKEKEEK